MVKSKRREKTEKNFVLFAKGLMNSSEEHIEGQTILNQYFENLVGSRHNIPSRRQLLTILRREPDVYARLLHLDSGVHRTVYSMNPIPTPVRGWEENKCSERRYKRASEGLDDGINEEN